MFKAKDVFINNFDLKILQSDIFSNDMSHFFSTRVGGDTPKPLQYFTLSAKDYPLFDNFAQDNLKIACEIIDADVNNLLSPNQQHTDKIAVIKTQDDIKKLQNEAFDAVITNLKNIPICLVFADCVPVLLYDEQQKVLACIHAGWKGSAKQISQKAVKIMEEEFQCVPLNIKAAIGPSICQSCFEVNPDVASQLGMSIKNDYDNIFLKTDEKIHVDLKLLNKQQLNEVGISKIDISKDCTCCNNSLFYSYRADNKLTGRHGMIAMIKE